MENTISLNMSRRAILPGLALLLFVVALPGCGDSDQPAEERLRPVRFVTVSDDSVSRDRSFSGTSKSSRESRLSFKVSGTIVNVPVQIGQRLNAGDLIAEIDRESYILQAQQLSCERVKTMQIKCFLA